MGRSRGANNPIIEADAMKSMAGVATLGDLASAIGVRTEEAAIVAELHPKLVSAAAGKDVWVVGGGDVAAQFVTAGLIDEMIVTYAPCSLGGGSRLLPIRSEWRLVDSGVNGDFVCARWRKA